MAFHDSALHMVANKNANYAGSVCPDHVTYRDCIRMHLVLMYHHALSMIPPVGTNLYHWNYLAYSYLYSCKVLGMMFRHYDVCRKYRQETNDELARTVGTGYRTAMLYLLRHTQMPDGRQTKGELNPLFMCKSDLKVMFQLVADNYREVDALRIPDRDMSDEEIKERLAQNYREMVQILAKHDGCLDMKFSRVYPVCMATDPESLNYAFPLTGPEAHAPVPRPPRREREKANPSLTSGTDVTLGEPHRMILMETGEVVYSWTNQTPVTETWEEVSTPSAPPQTDFVWAMERLRNTPMPTPTKRSNPDAEMEQQVPQHKRSSEGSGTDSDVAQEVESLTLSSPREVQYSAQRKLEIWAPTADDYKLFGINPPPGVFDRLGPEVHEREQELELEGATRG